MIGDKWSRPPTEPEPGRPEPFTGNGQPTFTFTELLPFAIMCGIILVIILHWLG